MDFIVLQTRWGSSSPFLNLRSRNQMSSNMMFVDIFAIALSYTSSIFRLSGKWRTTETMQPQLHSYLHILYCFLWCKFRYSTDNQRRPVSKYFNRLPQDFSSPMILQYGYGQSKKYFIFTIRSRSQILTQLYLCKFARKWDFSTPFSSWRVFRLLNNLILQWDLLLSWKMVSFFFSYLK